MLFEDIAYLCALGLATLCSTILLFTLVRTNSKLPEAWRTSPSFQNFKRSVFLLMVYLLIDFFGEFISFHLAWNGIYNGFVMSISNTLYILFLFGYFFINTTLSWKRYTYILLYLIFVIYLISGGYYYPNCVLPGTYVIIIYVSHFLVALLYITELLIKRSSAHFKFHLTISLSILIYTILASVVGVYTWFDMEANLLYSELIIDLHFTLLCLFYFSLALTFIIEILKLRRK
nr:hypothetical protein [uncultured Fluviicola sp.]